MVWDLHGDGFSTQTVVLQNGVTAEGVTCCFLRKWWDSAHAFREREKDVRAEWGRGILGRKCARKRRSWGRSNRKKKELTKQKKNINFLPHFKGSQFSSYKDT